jgi:hypothetical protein
MKSAYALATNAFLVSLTLAANFPYEDVQLTTADVGNFSVIQFGDAQAELSNPTKGGPECRSFPGTADWPSETEWTNLNISLGGALIKPVPVSSACYSNEPSYNNRTCRYLTTQASKTHFWLDDPLTVLTQWPQGSTCMPGLATTGNCTQGGFPVYVVNATTSKHVQAAVNFARNKHLRLVIK